MLKNNKCVKVITIGVEMSNNNNFVITGFVYKIVLN